VLALIARGHTNRQIAEVLVIAEPTVEIDVSNILYVPYSHFQL
jgi:DNA-binding NarL/FixJ family response regulator